MSLHDEPNPAIQLATQAGKMALSCPLLIKDYPTVCAPQEKFPESHINKSFIDHASSSSQGGWILLIHSFFHSFIKRRIWPIYSYLDLTLGQ